MRSVQAHLADGDLAFVAAQLAAATSARELFGELRGSGPEQLERLHRVYRQLALSVHPDRHSNDPVAHGAFVALQRLYRTAQEQVAAGLHDAPIAADTVVISTRRRTYTVGAAFAAGALADLYRCTVDDGRSHTDAILKIARSSQDNDLLQNEASALRQLADSANSRPVPAYIPRLLESFTIQDATGVGRQANAFPLVQIEGGPLPAEEFFSLAEIRQAYPGGVDPAHMAWIWRRLLLALSHAHEQEVIHGATVPTHILVHPEQHGLLLVDWCSSVQQPGLTGAHIPAIDADYASWYPPSVLAKAAPTPAVDLEMGLRSMAYLLGGDPLTGALPPRVPAPIQAYLQHTLWTGAAHTDAAQLYRDFAELIFALWGKRRFIPFAMPARR